MTEHQEEINQVLFKATSGSRANAISKALFENMEKKTENKEQKE